jgi:hypothetical protein
LDDFPTEPDSNYFEELPLAAILDALSSDIRRQNCLPAFSEYAVLHPFGDVGSRNRRSPKGRHIRRKPRKKSR